MRKLKANIAVLLIFSLVAAYMPVYISAATDNVIIHYHRDDGEYEPWNIWAWPEGGDGGAHPFDDEDSFGKIANIELSKAADKVGFIVRTDSWEKDMGDDRFIDTSLGNEIWVMSGSSEFFYEAPPGYETEVDIEAFTLKMNYKRYDNDYSGITFRLEAEDGMVKEISGKEIQIKNSVAVIQTEVKYSKKMNVSIWKDGEADDYENVPVSVSKLDENNQLEVYLMQGTAKVSKSSDFIKNELTIETAFITDVNEIAVKLSMPCKTDGGKNGFVIEPEADILEVSAANADETLFAEIEEGYADYFILKTKDAIDLSKKMLIKKDASPKVDLVVAPSLYASEGFEQTFTYEGDDLGAVYSKEKTTFKVWAPTASKISLLLYENGDAGENTAPKDSIPMTLMEKGVWSAEVFGDLKNVYYVYETTVNGKTNKAVDPYAKAVGVNGERGMVIDLSETDPAGFRTHSIPAFAKQTDAIIYEIHVRDLSMNENSGIQNKGKFLGFTENGTKNTAGLSTGLDHMKELGVTHVHLLPSFDYKTIDESKLDENKFNWGYDPQNYNVPEGSYSTDPYNGEIRVKEFKEMVQALHENDLRVVMDVVYNHTYTADNSNLTYLVPGYYYRTASNGSYTNGSGCGNETASERAMVRKFIVDSVVYWAKEYRVDGFRFDLMGLHDVETMNEIRAELNKIDPSIIVYGEGWTGGTSPLPDTEKALKMNAPLLDNNIACFSDDIRDAIKGSVFEAKDAGFVNSGKKITSNRDESIKFGIVGSVSHPQVNISGVAYSSLFWAKEPTQTITYASAHDNLSLWDKFMETNKLATDEEMVQMNKLSAAIVLTSQGIPFFQAGEEIARTKLGNENSYNASDRVNMIDWDNKTKYNDLFEYYQGLIELRKTYDVFRLGTAEEIRNKINFVDSEFSVVAYTIKDASEGNQMAVIFNGTTEEKQVALEANAWDVLVNGKMAGTDVIETIGGGVVTVPAKTAYVLLENKTAKVENSGSDDTADTQMDETDKEDTGKENGEKSKAPLVIGIVTGILAVFGGAYLWFKRKK